MTTATNKYKTFKTQYEAARKAMLAQAGAAFKDFASDLFLAIPELQSFGWCQYTPYFNDGDECVFNAYTDEYALILNGKHVEDYGDDDEPKADEKPLDHEFIAPKVSAMLREFDDDILLDLYGNHAEITIHRDGRVEVEEYSHD